MVLVVVCDFGECASGLIRLGFEAVRGRKLLWTADGIAEAALPNASRTQQADNLELPLFEGFLPLMLELHLQIVQLVPGPLTIDRFLGGLY